MKSNRLKLLISFLLVTFVASTASASIELSTRSEEMRACCSCDRGGNIKLSFDAEDIAIINPYLGDSDLDGVVDSAAEDFVRIRVTLSGTDIDPDSPPPELCCAISGIGDSWAGYNLPPIANSNDDYVSLDMIDVEVSDLEGGGDGADVVAYIYGASGSRYFDIYIVEPIDPAGLVSGVNEPWIRVGLYSELLGVDSDSNTTAFCVNVQGFGGLSKLTTSYSFIPTNLTINTSDNEIGHFYGSCSNPENIEFYFPHIVCNAIFQTEICLINKSSDQTVSGSLLVYDNSGSQIDSDLLIELPPNARRQISIGEQFADAENIGYAVYLCNKETICGYTKFFEEGTYRAAIPATSYINSGDIYISHIASNSEWWTGVSLINTTTEQKTVTIVFDNGRTFYRTIAGKEHQAFTIASLFGGLSQNGLKSAEIYNASGIIGLELFGSNEESFNSYLSGILLTDKTATEIIYPHVVSDTRWGTGIVAYNPEPYECGLTIATFAEDGTILDLSNLALSGKQQYVGTVNGLGFSDDTAWFSITSEYPITGFELFCKTDGQQLAGFTAVDIQRKEGVFAKIDKQGWTGIAFVNTAPTIADITFFAYQDNGTLVAAESFTLDPYEKLAGSADELFSQNIGSADYITFISNRQIVGFQLNGSSDGMMLDALPNM